MNHYDWVIIGIGVLGLVCWMRGCFRGSLSDCVLGLVLGLAAGSVYFFLFNFTHVAWLATAIFGAFCVTMLPFVRFFRTQTGRILFGALVVMAVAAAVLEHKFVSSGNALLVIEPFRTGKTWVFDEPRLGLRREPFVEGIPEMIDRLVKDIPGSEASVRLIFSQQQFPGTKLKLDWRREENGGNWYHSEEYAMEGWLCPALFKFFPRAPRHIYVKAEQR